VVSADGGVVAEPPQPVSVADLDLGSWTAEQGIAFEAAEWVLGSLIGWCSSEMAAERARPQPDPDRLAALSAEQAEYAMARRSLDIHDPEQVQRVLAEGGRLARQRYENTRPGAD
jgi:hypothetical protein